MWWVGVVPTGLIELLDNTRPEPPPAELDLGHHVVHRADLVAVDRVLRRRCRRDDAELRAAVEAAPQVISGKAGLDALLDPNAVRRERDRVAVVADQCV